MVFITIGILSLIEGTLILLFPGWTKKTISSLMKNPKTMRRLGMIEFIIAILLLIVGVLVRP